nr:immunoglobulin light chain junction region [Macaca mulatta]
EYYCWLHYDGAWAF